MLALGGLPLFMLKSSVTQELFHDIIKWHVHTTALGLHMLYYHEYLGLLGIISAVLYILDDNVDNT